MDQLMSAYLPFIRIISITVAVIVCLKATKVLIKIIVVAVAVFFLWPYVTQLLESAF